MKKILFLFTLLSLRCFAQIDYGARIGMSYNLVSSLKLPSSVAGAYDGAAAFNAGFFLKTKIPLIGFFVQPEILYSFQKSEFTLNNMNFKKSSHDINIPILFGQNIILFNWYLGPVFCINMDVNSNLPIQLSSSYKDLRVSGLVGVGVEIWKFMVDLRSQFAFSKLKSNINGFDIQERDILINLSLAYKL